MKTPIVDFVKNYANSGVTRLHMPGHKGKDFVGFEKFDITEIDGADVLYNASGIIAESQRNATGLFGSEQTLYSTEGSSLCIRAMVHLIKSYALQNGQKPIIAAARNAHKTFVTACAILDLDVDWLLPKSQSVISCVITAELLDEYLQSASQKPTAVYITSPDYLGNLTDIKNLSRVCKKYGVLLVVDNAHGAYLKFLPEDKHPISLGADMCCDSAHKTLPSLTGGAYLHVGKCAPTFLAQNAQSALSLFASTSPSYLIMQSLDAVNRYISDGYCQKLANLIKKVNTTKSNLLKGGYCLCGDEVLKITVCAKSYGYSGYELSQTLLSQNIVCEFCDPDYIVFMLSPENEEDLCKLESALLSVVKKDIIKQHPPTPSIKKRQLSLNQAIYATKEKKNVNDCIGCISASTDVACPPAIPIVLPGEQIDEDAIQCFKYYDIDEWIVVK